MVATPAVEVLVSSGTAHRLHEYTHDPAASYGREQRKRSEQNRTGCSRPSSPQSPAAWRSQ